MLNISLSCVTYLKYLGKLSVVVSGLVKRNNQSTNENTCLSVNWHFALLNNNRSDFGLFSRELLQFSSVREVCRTWSWFWSRVRRYFIAITWLISYEILCLHDVELLCTVLCSCLRALARRGCCLWHSNCYFGIRNTWNASSYCHHSNCRLLLVLQEQTL